MQNKNLHVHFIGIGGIGMSAIAAVMKLSGYTISGCDSNQNQRSIKQLKALGCKINPKNNSPECMDSSIDLVVYSSAIRQNNPEIIAAKKRGVAVIPRAQMLAEIMQNKKNILVAGSHGKTTTSSIISHVLTEAKLDPTVVVGGFIQNLDANYRYGKSSLLVAEADESDRSFLMLSPTIAVVTNIDVEHLDNYRDLEDIKKTFIKFVSKIPANGKAILCLDDPNTESIIPMLRAENRPVRHSFSGGGKKIITYGTTKKADFYISKCEVKVDRSISKICSGNKELGTIEFPMPGEHNALNALAAVAVCCDQGLNFDVIKNTLKTFEGIDQRFSFKGTYKNAELFDDYGHHPTEIEKILTVAKARSKNKLIVLFQPHRFTRTKKLWQEFIDVFSSSGIDHLVVTDIYAASEDPIENISSQRLVDQLKNETKQTEVSYASAKSEFFDVHNALDKIVDQKDLVLFLGAGKINSLISKLTKS